METNELDTYVMQLKARDKKVLDQFINDYQPFIIKTISEIKNGYIDIRNDEEFSVGLSAFYETIMRYDMEKGHFLPYAKLVIASRLKNLWKKSADFTCEQLEDSATDELYTSNRDNELEDEIQNFEKELKKFGLDFEFLIDKAPKHRDTRRVVIDIANKTCEHQDLVNHTFDKRRLPITKIAKRFFASPKVIKRNKFFIIAVMIIKLKKFVYIEDWIKIDKKDPKYNG
ncbi:MAG: RNA polymerase subunit sigma [Eubacteriales bacterium]